MKYIVKSFTLGNSSNIKTHMSYPTQDKNEALKIAMSVIDNKNGVDIVKNTRIYKGVILPDIIKSKDTFFFSTRNHRHCVFVEELN